MAINLFKRTLFFVILCLAQVLVLNHIHILNCATPLLYVYFVILFPRDTKRWGILLLCFFMGLVMDTFSNTPGVASASMTFAALIQPSILNLFLHEDSPDDLEPSFKTMGIGPFIRYCVVIVVIFCIVFFFFLSFNFFNWIQLLECVGGSTILTVLLIFAIESIRKK